MNTPGVAIYSSRCARAERTSPSVRSTAAPRSTRQPTRTPDGLKLHYLPPVRYWTGKEKPGELVDEVDIFLKATKPGGADRTKVVPFDKTGDKKTASIKIKIAPIVKLWLLKNPYVHKAQGGGAKDGKAALEYPDLEKSAEAIRGLFDAGGTMWVKPRLIIENVGGTKLTSTKLVHHAELFAGKDAEHKLELAKDAFTPETGYKITIAHPEGKATGAATVTLEGELKISDIVAERLRAIVLTAKRLDEHLKFDLTTKAIEFVQACLDHIAETEVEDLEKRLPEFFDFINAVKSYLAQLEIVAKAFVRTLKLHGLAYRRYMENGINFTMELLFHMLDKEQRELLWNGITQPRATIARGLRGLKVTPLVRVADDVAKAFKKEAQEAAEKVTKSQQSADELLDAAKSRPMRPGTPPEARHRGSGLEGEQGGAEKLAKELDEIEKVKKPIADEALEEAEKRMKDVEEGLTEGRSKLKGLEDREKPLEGRADQARDRRGWPLGAEAQAVGNGEAPLGNRGHAEDAHRERQVAEADRRAAEGRGHRAHREDAAAGAARDRWMRPSSSIRPPRRSSPSAASWSPRPARRPLSTAR